MKLTGLLLAGLLAVAVSVEAARRDDSHYVSLGPKRGYYVVEPGSPLQEKLGVGQAPVSDTASPLRAGHGTDIIAFRINRAGVLVSPPIYLAQLGPEGDITRRLATMIHGKTEWVQIERMFPPGNQKIRQPDGGMLVYHEVPVYNSLEEHSGFR